MAGMKRERPPGSGNWELRVYLGRDPVTGRKLWKYDRFQGGARAAERALAAFAASTQAERAPATEGTLGYLLTHWMRRVERDRSPETAAGYWLIIDAVWMPALGDVKLAKLTTAQLQAVIDTQAERVIKRGSRRGKSPSAATIERYFAVVRRALNEGVRMGWLTRSPADNVILPGQVWTEGRHPPTVEELLAILTEADKLNPGLGMALRIAAATGARRGELCGLRWRDVDLERRRIVVRTSVVVKKRRRRKDGEERKPAPRETIVKGTKTHQERGIAIDAGTVTLLQAQLDFAEDVASREVPGGRLARDAFVFSREPDGSAPIRPPWITTAFKQAAVAAGVPDVNLHQLRHLNATLQLAKGVPLAVVSRRLGHRYESTTANIYDHVIQGGDEAAATLLGELLGGAFGQPDPGPAAPAAEVIELPDRRAGEAS